MSDQQPRARKKPGRVPTSCAECRRLKLKCDRGIPCEKCVSRGCGSICPDGVLATGRGNRLVLANTKELHDEIDTLRRRIRELEDGLRTLQDSISLTAHPLLSNKLLQIKNGSAVAEGGARSTNDTEGASPDSNGGSASDSPPSLASADDSDFIDSFGTLSIGAQGEFTFLGRSARSEYLLRASAPQKKVPDPPYPRISEKIAKSGCDNRDWNKSIADETFGHLPSMAEAIYLSEIYLENGKFHYVPIPREELFDEILSTVYRADSVEDFDCPQALSLLFAVFALGSLFDPRQEPFNLSSLEYLHLARTSYGLVAEQTTLIGIQAMYHLSVYLELSNAEANLSHTLWTWLGHNAQLSHSIGLHLDSARWKLEEEVAQRRSLTFWAMFTFDTWTSFCFGRPPSVSLAFVDCPMPKKYSEVQGPEGDMEIGYHTWTFKFAKFMHGVMETAFGSKTPTYNTILTLDRQIRDFPVPSHLRPYQREGHCLSAEGYIQAWNVLAVKENTLIHLHRGYFAQALQESPGDLHSHRFLPSVMATYRSAWRIGQAMRCAWRSVPDNMTRMTLCWSQALTAGIVMCLLATRAPNSKMGQPSMDELDLLAGLFETAASTCRPAAHIMLAMRSLKDRGHEANGKDSDGAYICLPEAELDRLGGKTRLVSTSAKLSKSGRPGEPPAILSPGDKEMEKDDGQSPASQVSGPGSAQDLPGQQPPMTLLPPQNEHPALIQDFDHTLDNLFPSFPPTNGMNVDGNNHPVYNFPNEPSQATSLPDLNAYPDGLWSSSGVTPMSFDGMAGVPGGGGLSMPPSTNDVGGFGGSPNPGAGNAAPGTPNPAYLDATWQSFVEQLGF